MYGKIIDGALALAPKKIKHGDSITYNPPYEMLEPLGYLPVTFTDAPETEVGYEAVCEWVEQDGYIVQTWHIIESELTDEEALSILMGESV